MKIAVLFDGAGLARLGLEQAGHDCTGFELDPKKHLLSTYVGSGRCVLADATKVNLSGFDGVWASPPCQTRSLARRQKVVNIYGGDYLNWCLDLPNNPLWVENVISKEQFGPAYNAAQFLMIPIQNRNRIIGGTYLPPKTYCKYIYRFPHICPAIMATEHKGGSVPQNGRACRFYGRRLTIEECAYHQGFKIPPEWYELHKQKKVTKIDLYQAIGNGVPPYMTKLFGEAYPI